jgi:3-oxoacyl-[acyl-carrier protein] reductase
MRERLHDNSAAFVMAGSRGLGRAAAEALVTAGHAVALCSRDHRNVDEACDDLRVHGRVLGVVGDVRDAADSENMLEHARAELGPIRILVANAGGPPAGDFDQLTNEDWQRGFELTVMSFVRAVRHVLPDMRRLGGGRIILIGSSSIRRPIDGLTISNALRPALNGLVKDLALKLAGDGITVNMVAPGRIDTDRVAELDTINANKNGVSVDDWRQRSQRSIPLQRYGHPSEIGSLVAFLASDGGAYITGQSIMVDGGLTVSFP